MNKLIPQFTVLLLAGWSINVWAFSCMDASGQTLHSMAGHGSVNVYVNLQPTIAVGQNLVVDISRSVVCRNDAPTHRNDNVMMLLVRCMVGLYLTLLVLFDTMALPILFH